MSDASIAIAASGRDWALGLHRFVADHGGARVRVRIMHPEQALEESYDVLVIDDITSFLSARLVKQVQRRNRKVLGVFEEPAGELRLQKLGVNAVLPADADPATFVSSIVGLSAERTVDEEFAELIADLHGEAGSPDEVPTARVVAVGAAGGGIGATEVAVGAAVELANRGVRVCLVDADDVAPAVAQRLNLPLHPNLRTAMDYLLHDTGSIADTLHRHRDGFAVLPGLPNVRDWADVLSGGAIDVIAELATLSDVVLVNISSMVEQPATGARDEGRFGVARLVLGIATDVVLVAGPSPMAIGRLIEWLADTQGLVGDLPLHIAVNRFEDGLFAKGEIEQEIRRVVKPGSVTFLPHDPKLAKAAWEGTLPTASLIRALARAVDELTATNGRSVKRLRMGS